MGYYARRGIDRSSRSISMRNDYWDIMDELSYDDGISRSQLIERACREYIKTRGQEGGVRFSENCADISE